MNNYRFKQDSRYMTQGVRNKIPFEVLILLWDSVGKIVKSDVKTDYLQVFTFYHEADKLIVKHYQEEPKHERKIELDYTSDYDELLRLKVYIIDDITHSTALLSSEY